MRKNNSKSLGGILNTLAVAVLSAAVSYEILAIGNENRGTAEALRKDSKLMMEYASQGDLTSSHQVAKKLSEMTTPSARADFVKDNFPISLVELRAIYSNATNVLAAATEDKLKIIAGQAGYSSTSR
jgi:hypothetical protein